MAGSAVAAAAVGKANLRGAFERLAHARIVIMRRIALLLAFVACAPCWAARYTFTAMPETGQARVKIGRASCRERVCAIV